MKRVPRYDLPNAAPEPLRLVQLFLNTSNHETARELLTDPAALAAWFSEQGVLVDSAGDGELRRARRLRTELRRLASGGDGGRAFDDAARRARLTVVHDEPRLVPQAGGVDRALGMIVAAAYEAMRDGSWNRLKTCSNCDWAFWDRSKNRSGAWCSMQLCGSRLKVRRYRSRRNA